MTTELKILTDVYKEMYNKDEEGNIVSYDKLIRKNVITFKTVDVSAISSCTQALTKVGYPHKRKCIVYLKEEGAFMIKHKYEEIKNMINFNTIGYAKG